MEITIPPHSTDAERGVVGSILVDKDAIIQVTEILRVEDFYEPALGMVYGAMLDLFMRNRPIDLLTVREVLDDQKKLDGIGGNIFLADLASSIFTSANIYQYAQIVKNKSVLRKLIKSGNEIMLYGYDEATETPILLEKAEKSLFQVTQTFIHNKLTPIKDILNARYEEFAALYDNPDLISHTTIPSGFQNVDMKIG